MRLAVASAALLALAYASTVMLHEAAHAAMAHALGADAVSPTYGATGFDAPPGWRNAHHVAVLLAGPAVTVLQAVVLAALRRRMSPGLCWLLVTWGAVVAVAHVCTTLALTLRGTDIGRALRVVQAPEAVHFATTGLGVLGIGAAAFVVGRWLEVAADALAPGWGATKRVLATITLPWLVAGVAVQVPMFSRQEWLAIAVMSIVPLVTTSASRAGSFGRDIAAGELSGPATLSRMRALLALALALATWRALTFTFRLAAGDASTLPLVSSFIDLVAALASLLVGAGVLRRSTRDIGLAPARSIRALASGLAAAMVVSVFVVGFLYLAGALHTYGVTTEPTYQPLAAVLAFFLLVSAGEELLFRGILLGVGAQLAGRWLALGASSAVFAWAHLANPGANAISTATTATAGVVLGGMYLLSGNLWAPFGFHAGWNVFVAIGSGLPVSGLDVGYGLLGLAGKGPRLLDGGGYGPEGGLPALVFLALFALGLVVALTGPPPATEPQS